LLRNIPECVDLIFTQEATILILSDCTAWPPASASTIPAGSEAGCKCFANFSVKAQHSQRFFVLAFPDMLFMKSEREMMALNGCAGHGR
jgi:hypothetical protein